MPKGQSQGISRQVRSLKANREWKMHRVMIKWLSDMSDLGLERDKTSFLQYRFPTLYTIFLKKAATQNTRMQCAIF